MYFDISFRCYWVNVNSLQKVLATKFSGPYGSYFKRNKSFVNSIFGHFLRYFDQAIFENFYWTEFLELKLEPFAIGERIWPEFCSESFFGGHSLLATLFGQTLAFCF